MKGGTNDPRHHVLLIEDNPGDATLVGDMLAELGAHPSRVSWFKLLAEGMERLREGGIDLVLLDLNLPDSRGVETFTALHKAFPDVPVIVMSGLGEDGVGTSTVKLGAQDYLRKDDLNASLLDRTIRYALERNSSRQELNRSLAMIRRQNAVMRAVNRIIQEAIVCDDEEALGRVALDVAQGVTFSAFGWIGEINESGRLQTIAISDPGWKECRIGESESIRTDMIRDMEICSYWGRVIRTGEAEIVMDPESDPDRRGTPEGHPEIRCFMGVPLKRGNDTLGMISLANGNEGYTMEDLEAVQALAVAFVESLDRLRAETRLKESEEKFRGLTETSSDIVWEMSRNGAFTYCSR
ncbi:MAG: GAF domain-containing protein, partial [Deltaproteobacteria bacterium]|nr:GAF domain-containing protein [Deltaproteobacteria bacterium]